jgi:hypothetical protein
MMDKERVAVSGYRAIPNIDWVAEQKQYIGTGGQVDRLLAEISECISILKELIQERPNDEYVSIWKETVSYAQEKLGI